MPQPDQLPTLQAIYSLGFDLEAELAQLNGLMEALKIIGAAMSQREAVAFRAVAEAVTMRIDAAEGLRGRIAETIAAAFMNAGFSPNQLRAMSEAA